MSNDLKEEVTKTCSCAACLTATRREKLSLIRNEIATLVKEQLELKKLLSQKHDSSSPLNQYKRNTNRIKISILHEMSHRLRSCRHYHGDISDLQIGWMKKKLGI